MNHKYVNKETFEIIDNIFEVDEDIPQTILTLNKKGYYTKYCCYGHAKNPRLYKLYNVKNNDDFEFKKSWYIVNDKVECICDGKIEKLKYKLEKLACGYFVQNIFEYL